MSNTNSLRLWLHNLAAKAPTPGGGAAAALQAAIASSLVCMVSSYTIGGRWADREEEMRRINATAKEKLDCALDLIGEDERAVAAVMAAYARPKATIEEASQRVGAIQKALSAAAVPPSRVGLLAAEVVVLCEQLQVRANPNVISELAVAAESTRAALLSAAVNVEANAALLNDPEEQRRLAAVAAGFAEPAVRASKVVENVRAGLRA